MSARNRHTASAVALALLLLPGTLAGVESVETRWTVEATVPRGGFVDIENLLGSVELRLGTDPGALRVEAHVVAEARTREEAEALAASIRLEPEVTDAGVRARVTYPLETVAALRPPKKGGVKLRRDPATVEYDGHRVQVGPIRQAPGLAVHLQVTLPMDLDVSVRQAVGAIEGQGLRGRLKLTLDDGDVEIGQVFGSLDIETVHGAVRVGNFQGDDLGVRTTTAEVELIHVRARRAALKTGSGSIRGTAVTAEELSLESDTGAVQFVGFDPAHAELTTESGAIDLATRFKGTRAASIRSASGDVTLRVGDLTYFDLLTETEVKVLGVELGVVEQDGPATRYRRSTGGTELRVATGGSVTVRPYDASRLEILIGKSGG